MFSFRRLYLLGLPLLTFVFAPGYVFGQSEPNEISQVLGEEILAPSVAVHQVKSYILSRVAPPPSATNAQQWTEQAKRLRQHLLQDVVFHGWPDEWVNAPPKFEDLGVIETGQGYRLRKLRYEIVPVFQSVAILYEPEKLQGISASNPERERSRWPTGKGRGVQAKAMHQFREAWNPGPQLGMVFLRGTSPRG